MKTKLAILASLFIGFSIFMYLYLYINTLTRFQEIELRMVEGLFLLFSLFIMPQIGKFSSITVTAFFVNFLLLCTVKYEFDNNSFMIVHFAGYILLLLFFSYLNLSKFLKI